MTDVIIVGAGLFGSVMAKALARQGRKVVVFDSNRPLAGSPPSACLMKPSWFAGLGKSVHEPAIKILQELYGIEELEFNVSIGPVNFKLEKVMRVPPGKILLNHQFHPEEYSVVNKQVMGVGEGWVDVMEDVVVRHRAKLIIVAAGVWSTSLFTQGGAPEIQGLRGVSFYYRGDMPQGIIRPWAPYKQLVAFNITSHEIWAGDGSAIMGKNWTEQRERECEERCLRVLPVGAEKMGARSGLRPYVKNAKPCYFERVMPGVYLATGGAKNGTVAAGWCAHRILEETK